VYRSLAEKDPDILSIHITAGLSGTFNSAKAGADLAPEARVTHVNTKTLSAAAGWQVKAAARAVKAGWTLDKILPMLQKISDASESIYTLEELKYLIHGGRISHMKGLIASLLNIKPIIGGKSGRDVCAKGTGTHVQRRHQGFGGPNAARPCRRHRTAGAGAARLQP
jgi:DegV family protein with EDD domain